MKIKEVCASIEEWAHPSLQENYDNSGLLCGDKNLACKGALVTLDCTEEVVDEALKKECNLIIAHHPVIFSGLKSLTGENYVERTIIKAIKNNVAIYAAHTNLDKIYTGVNARIAEQLGLVNTRILSPEKGTLYKLFTFCPANNSEDVKAALFEAGAGFIGNYDHCSFSTTGRGTFRGQSGTDPFVGTPGKDHYEKEEKIEVIFPKYLTPKILEALTKSHPYEEVAYDLVKLENSNPQTGSGMIGELTTPVEANEFLKRIKTAMSARMIRHTKLLSKPIQRVAICGGSGSFLLPKAIAQRADIYISADFKYHEFFNAEGKIIIADIGHFESEQFTKGLIAEFLAEKFSTFAVHLSDVNTNPVHYFL